MPSLHLYMFGPLRVGFSDRAEAVEPPPLTSALLAYLALHPGSHTRSELSDALWPDLPVGRARRCLSTALWRLRQMVEPANGNDPHVVAGSAGVRLLLRNEDWVDIETFQRSIAELSKRPVDDPTDTDVRDWEATLELYAGDLLIGLDNEWLDIDRERLRQMRTEALVSLVRAHHIRGEYGPAVSLGSEILHSDPLREDVHRELMEIHLDSGQRAMALRQYELCRAALEVELGTGPMPLTQELFHRVRNDHHHHPRVLPGPTPVDPRRRARPALEQVSPSGRDPARITDDVREVLARLNQVAEALIGCADILQASIAAVPGPGDLLENAR